MILSSVLTPITKVNLQMCSQLGVKGIVVRYPGSGKEKMLSLKSQIEEYGLEITTIEGNLPLNNIHYGLDGRNKDIDEWHELLSNMKELNIKTICYNFMAGIEWFRTDTRIKERGDAYVTGFNFADLYNISFDHNAITADKLWENLKYFLEAVLPVAEEYNINLAMHPDDPPIAQINGAERIMNCVESFDRLIDLVPSPSNKICFCQGTFAEMGINIPKTIRHFGKKIAYVHLRDVKGDKNNFHETFIDNGQTDMTQAMRAYREIKFDGPLRPDHVPQLVGEECEELEAGYTQLGRIYAYGYINALIQSIS